MVNKIPLVSVIIPTYNRAHLVKDAINSALQQTYKNVEVIVIDDGSTDNTKEILAKYGNKINYLYKENGGCSSARNLGVSKARGEYIAFLDSDDLWYPEKIEKQTAVIKMTNYNIVMSDIEFVDKDNNHLSFSNLREVIKKDGDIMKYLLYRPYITCSYMLIKKTVFSKVGIFDETFKTAEDLDMLLRICSEYKAALVAEPLVKFRATAKSLHKELCTNNSIKAIKKIHNYAPDFARQNQALILKAMARINLRYAEDLLWHRYVNESKKQIISSIRNSFMFKALVLYAKCFIFQILSIFMCEYKDKGKLSEA